MAHSTASAGLSADLVKRYALARKRFLDTTSALTNGTQTGLTTNGATVPEAKPAPISSTGMTRCIDDDFLERLARLANQDLSGDRAPIDTYTTTSTEHGEIYKATRQFVDWLRRQIPGYGVEGAVSFSTPSCVAGRKGAKPTLNPVQF